MIIKPPGSPTAHSVIYQSITKTMLNIENSNEAHITFQINTFVLVEVLLISLTLIGVWNISNGITSFSYSVWMPISSIQDQIQEDKHVYNPPSYQRQWQWKLHIWPHKCFLIFAWRSYFYLNTFHRDLPEGTKRNMSSTSSSKNLRRLHQVQTYIEEQDSLIFCLVTPFASSKLNKWGHVFLIYLIKYIRMNKLILFIVTI